MRILYVVNDSWFFKSHRLPLANAAIKAGHEAHLAAVIDHTTSDIQSEGVNVHAWSLSPRSLNPISELKSFFSLLSTIRKTEPDLLHLVTIKSVLYGGIIARWLGVPSVVFAISGKGYIFSSQDKKQMILKKLAHKLYGYVLSHKNSVIVVQNMNDHDFFIENNLASKESIILIPGSGVDLDLFQNYKQTTNTKLPTVLFASRMLLDKGVKEFVNAAKQVNKDGVVADFTLAGQVDTENPRSISRQWLEALPKEMGINWVGQQEAMHKLIAESAFVVLPTTYGEGVPKILIEAAASGRAIITTNWPGCTDVVTHEYNGLLVEPKDTNGLAWSIKRLLDDPARCEQYGTNGRKLAEKKFSIQQVVATTMKIYHNLYSNVARDK